MSLASGLFYIDEELRQTLADGVDFETGEIHSETFEKLIAMHEGRRDALLLDLAKRHKELESEAAAIKKLEDDLAKRRRAKEHQARSINRAIWMHLPKTKGVVQLECAEVSLGWRVSRFVDVLDANLIPDHYLEPQPPKVKVSEIGKRLRAEPGEKDHALPEVPLEAAEMKTRWNLQIG